MNQLSHHCFSRRVLERELSKQERTASSMPYISFFLLYLALILFLSVLFLIDQLTSNATISLIVKGTLTAVATILLVLAWLYSLSSSRHWKKNILLLQQIQEEQRQEEAWETQKQQQAAIAIEEIRNRSSQYNLRRLSKRKELHFSSTFSEQPTTRSQPLTTFSEQPTARSQPLS